MLLTPAQSCTRAVQSAQRQALPLRPLSARQIHQHICRRSSRTQLLHAQTRVHLATSKLARTSTKLRSAAGTAEPLVAVEGDIVSIHFACKDLEGNVIESTKEAGEPLTFELGASSVMQNPLIEAFDTAVRGLGVGDTTTLEAQGGEWNRELLFKVPINHPEVERLQGRYKNQGGLKPSMLVELANGGMAVVLELTDEHVVLDANNMMAGKTLQFDLEVVSIERGS